MKWPEIIHNRMYEMARNGLILGRYDEDFVPLCSSRYDEVNKPVVLRSGPWLGCDWSWLGPLFQLIHNRNYRM